MRICPLCEKNYEDNMNYCLEDGKTLVNAADFDRQKTLSYFPAPARPTDENKGATDQTPRRDADFNQTKSAKPARSLKKIGLIVGVCLIGLFSIFGFFVYSLTNALRPVKYVANTEYSGNRSVRNFPAEKSPAPVIDYAAVETEIVGRVKDNFGKTYIKCLLKNIGGAVIENPSVSLTLYKNDLKIGDVSGKSEMKFLQTNQTIPIWISGSGVDEYTSARVDETKMQRVAKKDKSALYPPLVFSAPQMTNAKETSLVNFRPYSEMFYTVAGTVENRDLDKVNATIYVTFYDIKGEIVGIVATRPPELKKNEKAEFTASSGEMGLFGKPVTFELTAVDDD